MNLFVFGLGYSALAFIEVHRGLFARVAGTVRSRDKAERLQASGIEACLLTEEEADPALVQELDRAEAVLVSVPPGPEGDPVLDRFAGALAASPRLRWIGYLSTIGVYGDHGGAWVDESTPPEPSSERSRRRLAAERDWLALGARSGTAVQVFRLAGIYGPGRNALVNLGEGSARRIVKPGQVFNRIHVEDIAAALAASLRAPRPGAVYNVADDEPAPPQDVVAYAARLLGREPPPEIPFEEAELSPMGASFYGENKRASSRLVQAELGFRWLYPSYREGLQALHAAGEGASTAPRQRTG